MKKRLLNTEATPERELAKVKVNKNTAYLYLAKMLDEKTIYLEFYDKNKILLARHINNGEKMATENCETGKITGNGFSGIIYVNAWHNYYPYEAIGDTEKVLGEYLKNKGYYVSDYDEENLKNLIYEVSHKKRAAAKQRKQERINQMFSGLKPLPKSWDKFTEEQVMKERFGFFDTKTKMVYTTCCKSDIPRNDFKKFREKDFAICPICKRRIQMYSVSSKRRKPIVKKTAILADNIGEKIVFRYFNTIWNYADFRNVKKTQKEYVRTVYSMSDKKRNYELKSYDSSEFKECVEHLSYGYYCKYPEGIHYPFYEGVLFMKNIRSVVRKSNFKGLGIETMDLTNYGDYGLEALLLNLVNHNEFEQLIKAGLEKMVHALLGYGYSLKEGATKPHEILGIKKKYLDVFRYDIGRLNREERRDLLSIYKKASEENIDLELEKAMFILKSPVNMKCCDLEALNYTLNQLKRIEKICLDAKENFAYYNDYMSLVEKLGYSGKAYRYPSNLKTEHDRLNSLYQIKKEEIKAEQFEERAKELDKYNALLNGFYFLIPSSPEDLIKESKFLHHCVASCYSQKYADGRTNLALIRDKNDKETPLATMEFSNEGKVVQVRAVNNSTPNEEILKAVELFKKQKLMVAS